jgi:hypothetical protein
VVGTAELATQLKRRNTVEDNSQWAIVEIFGHQRFAGQISEYSLGGCSFVRVDVPDLGAGRPGFTKLFGNGAVYSITPCDEETARLTALHDSQQPMEIWSARQMLGLPSLAQGRLLPEDDDEIPL